jgi:hypothetical protein
MNQFQFLFLIIVGVVLIGLLQLIDGLRSPQFRTHLRNTMGRVDAALLIILGIVLTAVGYTLFF